MSKRGVASGGQGARPVLGVSATRKPSRVQKDIPEVETGAWRRGTAIDNALGEVYMQLSKVRVVLVFGYGAGVLAFCLVAGFRVLSAAEIILVTREVSLGKLLPGEIDESFAVSPDNRRLF